MDRSQSRNTGLSLSLLRTRLLHLLVLTPLALVAFASESSAQETMEHPDMPHDRSEPARRQEPARGTPVTIVALGELSGQFSAGQSNRDGGMAAIASYIKQERFRLRAEGGELIFVQSGDLTGSNTRSEFEQRLFRPGFSLTEMSGLNAIFPSPLEMEFARKLPPGRLPLVYYNLRDSLARSRNSPFEPYRILANERLSVFITGLLDITGEDFRSDPLVDLSTEFQMQSGIDIFTLLMHGNQGSPYDPYSLEFQKRLFGYGKKRADPVTHEPWPEVAGRTFLIETGRKAWFRRLPSGAYVCTVDAHQLCQIDIVLRNHRIIQIKQRFLRINAPGRTRQWIPPDPNWQQQTENNRKN